MAPKTPAEMPTNPASRFESTAARIAYFRIAETAIADGGDYALAPDSAFSWDDRGLCMQTAPEMFYPERGEDSKLAKKICSLCPVKQECLEQALESHENFGIRAGLSPNDRKKILKRRKAS